MTKRIPVLIKMVKDLEFPNSPVPMGIIKRVKAPIFEDVVHEQITMAKDKFKPDLKKLIEAGDTWEVK
ncbi:hypothetical protein CM15mP43_03390 [bacterium]|nr:MAG: hypothetical protein CM15mP43_03390 [bacterium]